jgi:hypothetical protein
MHRINPEPCGGNAILLLGRAPKNPAARAGF